MKDFTSLVAAALFVAGAVALAFALATPAPV